jgi:hypothetical protein
LPLGLLEAHAVGEGHEHDHVGLVPDGVGLPGGHGQHDVVDELVVAEDGADRQLIGRAVGDTTAPGRPWRAPGSPLPT